MNGLAGLLSPGSKWAPYDHGPGLWAHSHLSVVDINACSVVARDGWKGLGGRATGSLLRYLTHARTGVSDDQFAGPTVLIAGATHLYGSHAFAGQKTRGSLPRIGLLVARLDLARLKILPS